MTTKKSSRISLHLQSFPIHCFQMLRSSVGWLWTTRWLKRPLIYISNQGENNLVEYSIPKNTIQVLSLKAKNTSEAHWVTMPTLVTLMSFINRFRRPIPTIPPKPCMKKRNAMNAPRVVGPQHRGERRTNNATTPLIPITPKLIIPSEISSMTRFFLPPFLGLL